MKPNILECCVFIILFGNLDINLVMQKFYVFDFSISV